MQQTLQRAATVSKDQPNPSSTDGSTTFLKSPFLSEGCNEATAAWLLACRQIWPCAHITFWLKVPQRVSDKITHAHVITCLSVCFLALSSSSLSLSRASTFSLTVYLFSVLLINFHVVDTQPSHIAGLRDMVASHWTGALPVDGGDDDEDADAGSDTTVPDDDNDDRASFTSQQITAIQTSNL